MRALSENFIFLSLARLLAQRFEISRFLGVGLPLFRQRDSGISFLSFSFRWNGAYNFVWERRSWVKLFRGSRAWDGKEAGHCIGFLFYDFEMLW